MSLRHGRNSITPSRRARAERAKVSLLERSSAIRLRRRIPPVDARRVLAEAEPPALIPMQISSLCAGTHKEAICLTKGSTARKL